MKFRLIEDFINGGNSISEEEILNIHRDLIEDSPGKDAIYILPSGYFLNISKKFKTHQEYFLEVEKQLDVSEDLLEYAEEKLG